MRKGCWSLRKGKDDEEGGREDPLSSRVRMRKGEGAGRAERLTAADEDNANVLSLPLGLDLRERKGKTRESQLRRGEKTRREGDVELELKKGGEEGSLFEAFYDATQLLTGCEQKS